MCDAIISFRFTSLYEGEGKLRVFFLTLFFILALLVLGENAWHSLVEANDDERCVDGLMPPRLDEWENDDNSVC